jgi:hypothetical protein
MLAPSRRSGGTQHLRDGRGTGAMGLGRPAEWRRRRGRDYKARLHRAREESQQVHVRLKLAFLLDRGSRAPRPLTMGHIRFARSVARSRLAEAL